MRSRKDPTVPLSLSPPSLSLSHTHFPVEYITLFHCAEVEYLGKQPKKKIILPNQGSQGEWITYRINEGHLDHKKVSSNQKRLEFRLGSDSERLEGFFALFFVVDQHRASDSLSCGV